jgi:hypothetical protein
MILDKSTFRKGFVCIRRVVRTGNALSVKRGLVTRLLTGLLVESTNRLVVVLVTVLVVIKGVVVVIV